MVVVPVNGSVAAGNVVGTEYAAECGYVAGVGDTAGTENAVVVEYAGAYAYAVPEEEAFGAWGRRTRLMMLRMTTMTTPLPPFLLVLARLSVPAAVLR